ncbi:GID complex subunit containing RING finger motif [Polyrhizophydium stewartii]|uniref:GID complex subunit containing RING finger motif n=1 Tax=Polyrhizophydium stewartii TaxID=2732419 RepID=A0ABR4NJS7_9FUNG
MDSSKLNHEGLLALDQPLVKVPLEQLKRAFRSSQKHVEKEMAAVSAQLESALAKAAAKPDEACSAIDATLSRLQGLKRKLAEIKTEEDLYVGRTKLRLEHLAEMTRISSADSEAFTRWSKTRLSRILVDYMLRKGLSTSPAKLAADSHIEVAPAHRLDFVDIELFAQSRRIEDALRRRSCAECLQWCSENKSSLKKMKSTLEFSLRLQEYIELVRARNLPQAISHARKFLTPWSDTHMREIQQAMGMLAFSPKTACGAYKALFDDGRWEMLTEQFRADNYALNSLTLQPLLHMTLQAGLSSLKTRTCYQPPTRNINCPVCDADTFGYLAEKLPCAHHVNSCIVCRITGRIMDADNPPLVLPNGQVYSSWALQDMALRNNGAVTCPATGSTFHVSEARKAFIM